MLMRFTRHATVVGSLRVGVQLRVVSRPPAADEVAQGIGVYGRNES
jgi:hypothetical protein